MSTRILALSPIPEEGAGCRFRVAQFRPFLESAGFALTIHPLFDTAFFRLVYRPGNYLRKAAAFAARTRERARIIRETSADVCFIYREAYPIGPPVFERRLARQGLPIVYDFDDAVYLPNTSEANRFIASFKNPGKTAEILSLSAEVMAGNDYLAAYARRYSPNVTVIPTCVDTAVWRPRAEPRAEGQPLVIGWIGTPTTTPYLLELEGALRELAARHRFVLRVSGSVHPVQMAGVTVENVPWTLASEVELFNTCDIGVYPLPDDEWTHGKCGFKAIQFMACGVPTVAAPVGVNQQIISDGVSGLFARTPGEWVQALERVLTDAALRRRLGAAGREAIERRYALAVVAPQVVRVFERASARRQRAAS